MNAIRHARIVLENDVLNDGVILHDSGRIVYVGKDENIDYSAINVFDAGGKIAGPGFVDIHCHAGGKVWIYEDPVAAARYQLSGGTTSLVCSLYHDIDPQRIFECTQEIREAMNQERPGNIVGIHMEGPYLSKKYGAHPHTARVPDPAEYKRYLSEFGDLILQWTYSPEVEGTAEFSQTVRKAGITLSIGHSEADAEAVFGAVNCGATICTHITDASGTSPNPSRYGGTKEVSFDQAAMLCDELYCELINDGLGAHVRPLMTRLILKTIGIDRMIGITDAGAGSEDDSEINVVGSDIFGSKLQMIRVAKNFSKNTKLTVPEVFKVCSLNPAKAVKLTDVGKIETGRKANIVLVDDDWNLEAVWLNGEVVINAIG